MGLEEDMEVDRTSSAFSEDSQWADSIFEIEGGARLRGEVRLSGAKNAALPLIVAACLGEQPTTLTNVPLKLRDVTILIELLRTVGASVETSGDTVRCSRGDLDGTSISVTLASQIRYSLLLLGLFSALRRSVFLPTPGGCRIGERKYDLHLLGLRALGAVIEELHEGILLNAAGGLSGRHVDFYLPTTTGTENVMIAASLAEGVTTIRNANTRPEVQQLGKLLSHMGAQVTVSNRIVEVVGAKRLRGGGEFRIMPGWDEAATYVAAAGMTNGEIAIMDFSTTLMKEEARYFNEAGIKLFEWQNNVYVSGKEVNRQAFELFTAPYPGVNSDMQPIFAALAVSIPGVSTITDLRFTDRFQYVDQLKCFGANIDAFGNTAIVTGGKPLVGAEVSAVDLRGGAACVLCGLIAEGVTRVHSGHQIERGYENIAEKMTSLGASVYKLQVEP